MALEDVLKFTEGHILPDSEFYSSTGLKENVALSFLKSQQIAETEKVDPELPLISAGARRGYLKVHYLGGLPFAVPVSLENGAVFRPIKYTPVADFDKNFIENLSVFGDMYSWGAPEIPEIGGYIGKFPDRGVVYGFNGSKKFTHDSGEGEFKYFVRFSGDESGLKVNSLHTVVNLNPQRQDVYSMKLEFGMTSQAQFMINQNGSESRLINFTFDNNGLVSSKVGTIESYEPNEISKENLEQWMKYLEMGKGKLTRGNLAALHYISGMQDPFQKIDFDATLKSIVNAVNNPQGVDFENFGYTKFV